MTTETLEPRAQIADLRSRLVEARRFLDVDRKVEDLAELKERAADPGLWDDPNQGRKVTQRVAALERTIEGVRKLESSLDDAEVLLDLSDEASDPGARAEVLSELGALQRVLAGLERESLYFDEYDDHNAILSVHAGAGGVDAQDWAEILTRMYQRFLEEHQFSVTVEDVSEGEEAGVKSVTMTVRGEHAYGTLESERGTHRLVRISPFDSNSRRHTSFAGVDVVPELADDEGVEISSDDLRIDTYRSQGAGGQHVNKTDSAVRITHLPTGIVVQCQNERSQLQNRTRAMAILKARLAELSRQERLAQIDEIRGEQGEAAWGRQIRSYVMQPYQMVKDLRTDVEVGNIAGVLDGDLDPFIDGYLRWRRLQHENLRTQGS
ncbi:MAG: peptide chain release factor 2 [Actinomycetota bacterium]|nr:peptide chain release factor 2 [Actinomycetota bacterium]